MASIKQRPDGLWRARVQVGHGKEMAKHFRRKVDAEKWAAIQEGKMATGEWIDPRHGQATLKEYAEAWRLGAIIRPGTATLYESHLRLHVYPTLGRKGIGAIRTTELQAWVKALQEGLAPATVETIARVLGSIFRSAIRDRLITHSPMDGVKVPKPDRAQIRPLTPEQVGDILDATGERWRALLALGAGCGMRSGEVLGIAPEAVDFMRRRARVERQLLTPARVGEPFQLGPPKTRSSRREMVLPSPIGDASAYHLERWPAAPVPGLHPHPAAPGDATLIFTMPNGQPIRRQNLGRIMTKSVKAVGLPSSGLGAVTFHDLRHHYASLLIGSGLSVKAVQSAMGHATAAETLDTYGHLWPAEEDTMAAVVEAAWRAGGNAKSPGARSSGAL